MFQLSGFYLVESPCRSIVNGISRSTRRDPLAVTRWSHRLRSAGWRSPHDASHGFHVWQTPNIHSSHSCHIISWKEIIRLIQLLKKNCPAHVPLRARFFLASSPAQTFVRRQSSRGHLPPVASGGWARSGVLLGLELPIESRCLCLNTNMCAYVYIYIYMYICFSPVYVCTYVSACFPQSIPLRIHR